MTIPAGHRRLAFTVVLVVMAGAAPRLQAEDAPAASRPETPVPPTTRAPGATRDGESSSPRDALQAAKADEHPLSLDVQRQLREQAERAVAETTQRLEQSPDDIDALSRRGDAYFQLAKFPEAAADFDRMVQHRPELDAEHWRRGIAWFYAEEFQQAAAQFERYHTFDQVDRENGVWRWLSQRRAHGADAARAGLLKYEKDDRPPLNDVYRLFAGTMTGDELTAKLDAAELSQSDRDVQEFYAHLYIGLHHAVEDRPSEALPQLRAATANRWAPTASYGPRWMWHVGRVHYERLRAAAESTPQSE